MSRSTSEQLAGVDLADPELRALLERGLQEVEELLRREVQSEFRFLTETSLHLVDAGGKRFRPLFTLLAGQFGPDKDRTHEVVRAAAVVELVHLATLYHDDVMDEATMRRGAVSANARWDNTVAILTGDFLFAHASRLVADLGPDAVRIIACTFAELVTGQMRETLGPVGDTDPVAHYLAVVSEKTGSLIATAGRYGAMFSGASTERIEALHRFGETIGTAFQISDDIIDIASPAAQSGKTPGTDLREGVRTLPMLYALAEQGPGVDRLRALLAGPLTDEALIAEALWRLRESPGLDRAVRTLRSYTDSARSALDFLPPCSARDALASVTDYLAARTG
ncbi:MAG TPA: polyprenyl synthetase family protein [Pseudonocardiaceae bacterium]|jgi:heptaprenyl diphosphate synthase|nr:polyprenyl synthetase family protein [Pseudonocardiaceae bacterium]